MPNLKDVFHRLLAPRINYQPLIEVRISKDALLHNFREFKAYYPDLQFAPVIKSNAYGHGMVTVAKILDDEPKAFFMVDSFYEALVLRRAGIRSKILMLGYNRVEQLIDTQLKDCAATIVDFSTLKEVVAKLKKLTAFHLKIDTGMHRQGLHGEEIAAAIELIKSNPNFILEGLCSHLADADGANQAATERQIAAWNEAVDLYKANFPSIEYFHASATAGAAYSTKIKGNVLRLGIGLYGFNVSPFEKLDLQPVLEMVSVVSSLRTIPAGEKAGYNGTWTAPQNTVAATVPVGYNEGVDRRLSNCGFYKIGGAFYPIIGRVSMNITSIDVTDVAAGGAGSGAAGHAGIKVGDEVVIFSRVAGDKNSIEAVAAVCGTISYEILVHIPSYLRRVVV
jgi:alanine racemase